MLWGYFLGWGSREAGQICSKPKPSQKPFSSGNSTTLAWPQSLASRYTCPVLLPGLSCTSPFPTSSDPRACSCPGRRPDSEDFLPAHSLGSSEIPVWTGRGIKGLGEKITTAELVTEKTDLGHFWVLVSFIFFFLNPFVVWVQLGSRTYG